MGSTGHTYILTGSMICEPGTLSFSVSPGTPSAVEGVKLTNTLWSEVAPNPPQTDLPNSGSSPTNPLQSPETPRTDISSDWSPGGGTEQAAKN